MDDILDALQRIAANGGTFVTIRDALRLTSLVAKLETAHVRGLVDVHRSSIGEVDERATWTLTDAGRLAIAPTGAKVHIIVHTTAEGAEKIRALTEVCGIKVISVEPSDEGNGA
jgi:hypothetical protein